MSDKKSQFVGRKKFAGRPTLNISPTSNFCIDIVHELDGARIPTQRTRHSNIIIYAYLSCSFDVATPPNIPFALLLPTTFLIGSYHPLSLLSFFPRFLCFLFSFFFFSFLSSPSSFSFFLLLSSLLFLSLVMVQFYLGGGGGLAPPSPPPHQYASAVCHVYPEVQ